MFSMIIDKWKNDGKNNSLNVIIVQTTSDNKRTASLLSEVCIVMFHDVKTVPLYHVKQLVDL